MYRVFLGAPSKEISEHASYEWQTISSLPTNISVSCNNSKSFILPADTLEAASQRISVLYENVIFHDDEGDDASADLDEGTVYTWPPTPAEPEVQDENRSRVKADDDDMPTVPSFLLLPDNSSTFQTVDEHHPISASQQQMQRVQETRLPTGGPDLSSHLHSDLSLSLSLPLSLSLSLSHSHSLAHNNNNRSIAHFPSFHFNPNALSTLSQLTKTMRKASFLSAVLEVDGNGNGPDVVRIKSGPDAGKEVAVLRMILGDEEGRVGRLTAWREVAEVWGGSVEGVKGVRRGDVVLIESASLLPNELLLLLFPCSDWCVWGVIDVNGSSGVNTSPSLTASPYLGSKLTICYRTMPVTEEDERLRPDLRLGGSDAAVRKVAGVVRWFERMAGL
ncbi:hypothetical protein AX17_000791 [Amanita inopinata Kibby_2008]|nr:hypothetical protein AX17_000791 [Amanita inopinata Kibby_2008]